MKLLNISNIAPHKSPSSWLVAVCFAMMTAFVLFVVLFGDNFSLLDNYWFFLKTSMPRGLLALTGLASLCILFIPFRLFFKNKGTDLKVQRRNMLVFGSLFFISTSVIVFSYFFSTGWDVQIIMDTARSMAYDGTKTNQWYYQECPNNILLTEIHAAILWVSKPLNLGEYDFFSVLVFQNLLVTLALLMLYQTVFTISGKRDVSAYSAFLFTAIIGLSPWMSIPYSDTFGLIFPISLIWIYTCNCFNGRQRMKWLLMAVITVVGFKIKPQTSFAFIIIVLFEAAQLLQNRSLFNTNKRTIGLNTAALVSGVVISFALTGVCCRMFLNGSQKEFGAAHYFMIGMNDRSYGGWNKEDLMFARQFSTNRERNKSEFSKAVDRIRDMGFKGTSKLLCKKTMLTFYDGTFNWGYEGEFYKELHPEVMPSLSGITRNIYYNKELQGKHYNLWSNLTNTVWYGLLLLVLIAAFGKYHKSLTITMVTLMALILFQLIFETRSRYIISNLPLFLIMGTTGVDLIFNTILENLKVKLRS